MFFKSLCCAIIILSVCNIYAYQTNVSDTVNKLTETDTTITTDVQENEFQNDLNALFTDESFPIDSFAWNTKRINSGHFDPSSWSDTAVIPLLDSTMGKEYVHPFQNIVTSPFGPRGYLWHYGTDIKLLVGDTVRCPFNGVVRVTEFDKRGYGLVVVVRHPNGLETIYGHLSKTTLRSNDVVKAGDMIGLGGNTGHSTGSHLHFEMRFYGEPFDPSCFIDFDNFCLKSDTIRLSKANFDYLTELQKITYHRVQRGETLKKIARAYHTSVKTLCRLNHISAKTRLGIGRRLAIGSARSKRTDPKYSFQPKALSQNHTVPEAQSSANYMD